MSNKHRPHMNGEAKLPVLPNATLGTLTDKEMGLAYQCVVSLMRVGIPTALYFNGTGVMYDGAQNLVERRISLTWLSCKGEPLITATRSGKELTLELMQILANGIAQQYQEIARTAAVAT